MRDSSLRGRRHSMARHGCTKDQKDIGLAMTGRARSIISIVAGCARFLALAKKARLVGSEAG